MKLIKGKTLLGKIIYPMVAESPRHSRHKIVITLSYNCSLNLCWALTAASLFGLSKRGAV